MKDIEHISHEVLNELKTSIASGHLKKKWSVVQIVEHEFIFWETNIKAWCSDSEHYLSLWVDYLGRCGCSSVSATYVERLLSSCSKRLRFKRTSVGFRRMNNGQ